MYCENHFVEEIHKNNMTDPLEILNWYRNLYYKEGLNTERGMMAVAINALFMKYNDAFMPKDSMDKTDTERTSELLKELKFSKKQIQSVVSEN